MKSKDIVYICDGIPIRDLEIIAPNRILKGYHKHDLVIIKINQKKETLEREIQTMKSLGRDPPHAVLYLDHMFTPSTALITKYFSEPLNSFFVESLDSVQLHEAEQILKAIEWLHSKQIVHCDIKPANILLLDKGGGRVHIKLCDFDSARKLSEPLCHSPHDELFPLQFTVSWVSPEVYYYSLGIDMFGNSSKYPLLATYEMDYFSLGLVLACTLSKSRTPDMIILPNSVNFLQNCFATRSYLRQIPSDLVSDSLHAIEKLWSFQPSNRGTIGEVLLAISDQRRTKLSQKLIEEAAWRKHDAEMLEMKLSHLQQLINDMEKQKLSSSPELTEMIQDLYINMSSHMELHYQNYLENIRDIRDDVVKGQRLLEALQNK